MSDKEERYKRVIQSMTNWIHTEIEEEGNDDYLTLLDVEEELHRLLREEDLL